MFLLLQGSQSWWRRTFGLLPPIDTASQGHLRRLSTESSLISACCTVQPRTYRVRMHAYVTFLAKREGLVLEPPRPSIELKAPIWCSRLHEYAPWVDLASRRRGPEVSVPFSWERVVSAFCQLRRIGKPRRKFQGQGGGCIYRTTWKRRASHPDHPLVTLLPAHVVNLSSFGQRQDHDLIQSFTSLRLYIFPFIFLSSLQA